jgi:hypothetical protein
MRAPLYDDIHSLAINIVNASENGNEEKEVEAYDILRNLCDINEGGNYDHPLQWEALGDFSDNHIAAIDAYKKGLSCSQHLGLTEYSASINFAMAESYKGENDFIEAHKLALESLKLANTTKDKELKQAINDFIKEFDNE